MGCGKSKDATSTKQGLVEPPSEKKSTSISEIKIDLLPSLAITPTKPDDTPGDAHTLNGLSIKEIEEFIEKVCGGSEAIKTLTVEDVFKRFVSPITTSSKCCYCDVAQVL